MACLPLQKSLLALLMIAAFAEPACRQAGLRWATFCEGRRLCATSNLSYTSGAMISLPHSAKVTFPAIISTMLFLASCTMGSSTSKADAMVPFITAMPAQAVLDSQYKGIVHDISSFDEYHFDIVIPKRWEILDIALEVEPEPGDFTELGVFRQPGEWKTNEFAAPLGEISVSLIVPEDTAQSARDWLKNLISTNIPAYAVIEERTAGEGSSEAADMLFRYTVGENEFIMRATAFRANDRIILINCSDSLQNYRDNALACYVALTTFKLRSADEANPFRE